jgi:hypothetical protein
MTPERWQQIRVGAGDTVVVNVTVCPTVAGLGSATSVVVVEVSAFIVSVNPAEVEVVKPALPE